MLPVVALLLTGNWIWSIFTAVSDAKETRRPKPVPVGGDSAKASEGKADLVPAVP
jgi:hypothetical protein